MREIKFRAWDTTKEHFVEVKKLQWWPGGLFLNDTTKSIDGNPPFENIFGDGYKVIKLMQYTGLKDKNGKEIFEGDIVNEFRTSRSFPEGKNYKRVIGWSEDMTLDDSYGQNAVGFNLFGGVLEVIGNIYENSELLDKE